MPSADAAVELGAAVLEVVVERVAGASPDGHHALLVALAEHADEPVAQVEVGAVEADQLADADAAGVEGLEDGAIPQRAWLVAGHCVQQRLDLGLGERLRDPLRDSRRAHVLARDPRRPRPPRGRTGGTSARRRPRRAIGRRRVRASSVVTSCVAQLVDVARDRRFAHLLPDWSHRGDAGSRRSGRGRAGTRRASSARAPARRAATCRTRRAARRACRRRPWSESGQRAGGPRAARALEARDAVSTPMMHLASTSRAVGDQRVDVRRAAPVSIVIAASSALTAAHGGGLELGGEEQVGVLVGEAG